MFLIAKHQLRDGLADARFLFMSAVVLLLFAINGFLGAERYLQERADWLELGAYTRSMLESTIDNLQRVADYEQLMAKPPSALAFIADGGGALLPNVVNVNAFLVSNPDRLNRGNETNDVLPPLDWVFIVGTVMTLIALLLSFATVNGEKRDGTLKQVLSYPVSRLTLFAGKYLGHLAALVLVLLLGAVLDLLILTLLGALPGEWAVIEVVGWAVLLSIVTLSFFLLLGMGVSSMTARPAVSLVVLIIIWVIAVAAIPGIASLVGKRLAEAPSEFTVQQEIDAASKSIWDDAPPDAGRWNGDPRAPWVIGRAQTVLKMVASRQRIDDAATAQRIGQRRAVQQVAALSPTGLLAAALEEQCGTGIAGYEVFYRTARQYREQLHNFVEERDKLDPDSPHLIYSWERYSERGTYSTKPVTMNMIPRAEALWLAGGLARERPQPLMPLLVLLALNLAVAAVAFIALARFDPR